MKLSAHVPLATLHCNTCSRSIEDTCTCACLLCLTPRDRDGDIAVMGTAAAKREIDTHRVLILRVACTLGETFTKEELAIACWKAHPDQFGFKASDGISRPHTNATNCKINGSTGLVAHELLDWVSPGVLTVTPRGRRQAHGPGPRKPVVKPRKPKPDCSWCGHPAVGVDEENDPACREHKSERAARKARRKREAAKTAEFRDGVVAALEKSQ